MEYTEKDLVKIAKRENNTKRNYLVVDPLQGKHIPVVPSKALDLFAALADTFREKYKDEKLLLVGFAEQRLLWGQIIFRPPEKLFPA